MLPGGPARNVLDVTAAGMFSSQDTFSLWRAVTRAGRLGSWAIGLGAFVSACSLCAYRSANGQRSLELDQGASCPAARDVTPTSLGSDVLEVDGFVQRNIVPGQQQCCYQAQVSQPALDEVTTFDYGVDKSCDTVAQCGCVAAASLLSDKQAELQAWLPDGAAVAQVISGPTYSYYATCEYTVRVTRSAGQAEYTRCTKVSFPTGTVDVKWCPAPDTLLGTKSPLLKEDGESIESIVSGPTLGQGGFSVPSVECVYQIKYKETADACG